MAPQQMVWKLETSLLFIRASLPLDCAIDRSRGECTPGLQLANHDYLLGNRSLLNGEPRSTAIPVSGKHVTAWLRDPSLAHYNAERWASERCPGRLFAQIIGGITSISMFFSGRTGRLLQRPCLRAFFITLNRQCISSTTGDCFFRR